MRLRRKLPIAWCLGLAACTVGAHAQADRSAWHGHWQGSDGSLRITAQGIQQGAQSCAWVRAKPAKPSGCVAFDDLPVAKDQLARLLDDAEVALKAQAAKKGTHAEALPQRRAELQRQRQALKAIGPGEFATVAIAGAGSGDCAEYFFLDKAVLYRVTDCSSQPQSARLLAYKKAP